MSAHIVQFDRVTFVYDAGSAPILQDVTVRLGSGWHGIIGANGSGKTTLLRLVCGQIEPTSGVVHVPGHVVCCEQRTDEPPQRFDEFLSAADRHACELRGRLGIDASWALADRWHSLSHGERKRAQIAIALWSQPQVLAIDEPTNHIDSTARTMLANALRAFRGTGLLVSHDRQLLDELCSQTLFMEPPNVIARPGGYTKSQELADAEQARARTQRHVARQRLDQLQAEVTERRREADMADRKRSKRGLALRDSDGRAKIDLARVSGKDGKAGRLLDQLDGRLRQTQARVDAIFVKKQRRLGIELSGEPSRRNLLVRLDAAELPLGQSRVLRFPDLSIRPTDRIAVVGPNGTGKSTLVRHILASLALPLGHVVYVPQEIDAQHAARIADDVRRLPETQLGKVMSAIDCLGSSPSRLLETEQPSPGELRKLLLALGMSRVPHLIVMDEPTNHLDLPSIKCMEEALAEVQCAMLLVSHDLPFLKRVTNRTWELLVEDRSTCFVRV